MTTLRKPSVGAITDNMLDIMEPQHGVDVTWSADKKTLWVNVDGVCALRVCQIPRKPKSNGAAAPSKHVFTVGRRYDITFRPKGCPSDIRRPVVTYTGRVGISAVLIFKEKGKPDLRIHRTAVKHVVEHP